MNQFQTEFLQYQSQRSEFWNAVGMQRPSFWSRHYQQLLTHIYRYLIPEHARVLELGCGAGNLLASLKPSYGVGIDFSSSVIDLAKERHPQLHFFSQDAHNAQIEDKTFDYIILSDLINDAWDIQAILENIRKYCQPQTRIIFNFHSHLWGTPLKFARALGLAKPNLNQNWLTKQDLQNYLS